MQSRISVIAIDIPSPLCVGMEDDPDVIKFMSLSADEKTDKIIAQIEKIMAKLESEEPDVLHIITWREYGLGGSDSRFITVAEKNRIKKRFFELAQKYPSLVIISGTMASLKHFNRLTEVKYAQIKNEYTHFKTDKDDRAFISHLKKVEAAQNQGGVDVLRNSCFIFQGRTIQRHDKTTPCIEEVSDYNQKERKNTIFRVGKSKTENPVVEITHPHTNEIISIGIEICYEHSMRVLKDKNLAKPLDIHIIISDYTSVKLPHVCSSNLVYVDSLVEPKIIHKENPAAIKVDFYCVGGMKEPGELTKPVKPVYPFEIKVLNCISNAIEKCTDENTRNKLLAMYQQWMQESSALMINIEINNKLNTMIEHLKHHNSESKKDVFWLFRLFQSYSATEVLLLELTELRASFIEENKTRMLSRKDILSLRPASKNQAHKYAVDASPTTPLPGQKV